MVNIDNDTLMVALQSVYESINRFEGLLESETITDSENITELLITYDEAFNVLSSVYKKQIANGAKLPPYKLICK